MASRTAPTNVTLTKKTASVVAGLKVIADTGANIEIHNDNAVWDTVNNKFLIEGKDFDGKNLNRT